MGRHPAPASVCRRLDEAHATHARLGFWPVWKVVDCERCTQASGKRVQHRLGNYLPKERRKCGDCGHPAGLAHHVRHREAPGTGRDRCAGCRRQSGAKRWEDAGEVEAAEWPEKAPPPPPPPPEEEEEEYKRLGGRPAGGRPKTLGWRQQISRDCPWGWPTYLRTGKGYSARAVARRLAVRHRSAPFAARNRQDWQEYTRWLRRQGIEPEGHPTMCRLRANYPGFISMGDYTADEVQDLVWGAQEDARGVARCCGHKKDGRPCREPLEQGVSETHHILTKAAVRHGGHAGPCEPWNMMGLCGGCHRRLHLKHRRR